MPCGQVRPLPLFPVDFCDGLPGQNPAKKPFDHYSFLRQPCAQCGFLLAALTVNNAEPARRKVFDGFAVYRVVNAIQFQIAPVGGVKVFPPGKLARFFLPLPGPRFHPCKGLLVVLAMFFFRPLFSKKLPCTKI